LPGTQIETGSGGQGSMMDATDRYFSFSCDIAPAPNGREEVDFIRYDRDTDIVTTQEKWYTVCPGQLPSGCTAYSSPAGVQGYSMFRMNQHPNENYITVLWQCAAYNSTWTRGCGTEVFGPSYNFLGPASAGNYHQDNGFDVNGVPVWVGAIGNNLSIGNQNYWSLEVTNLTTLSPTGITSKLIQLPCTYLAFGAGCTTPLANAKSEHISMTGTWGSTPGYALYSTLIPAGEYSGVSPNAPAATTLGTAVTSAGSHTVTPASMASIGVGTQQLIDAGGANIETVTVTAVTSSTFTATFAKTHTSSAPVTNLSVGNTGFGAMENIAVKIDTTAANGSNAQFWRLGRAMSIRDADYNAEPHTFVNRDWTAYVWGSNWNTDGGTDNGYYTRLGGVMNYNWTQTISPLGSGTVIGINCATGSYASGTTIGSGSGCLAVAATGYSLAGTIWTGVSGSARCSGLTNPCPPFALGINSTATANFTPNNYTVTTSVVGSGTVTGCPTGSYTYNSTVNCTATASGGYTFTGWSGTCGLTGNTTPTSFTMPLSCTVVATFTTSGINPPLSITGTVTLSGGLSLP
jgi:hypothetical protein